MKEHSEKRKDAEEGWLWDGRAWLVLGLTMSQLEYFRCYHS